MNITPDPLMASFQAIPGTITITNLGGPRPWQDRWRRLLRGRQAIEDVYAGNVQGSERCNDFVYYFITDCAHLPEWIKKDPAVEQRIKSKVNGVVKKSDALLFCVAVANTDKHHTRYPGETEARIKATTMGTGATVEIESVDANGATTSWDALKLANQAMADWSAFIAKTGLEPGTI